MPHTNLRIYHIQAARPRERGGGTVEQALSLPIRTTEQKKMAMGSFLVVEFYCLVLPLSSIKWPQFVRFRYC